MSDEVRETERRDRVVVGADSSVLRGPLRWSRVAESVGRPK